MREQWLSKGQVEECRGRMTDIVGQHTVSTTTEMDDGYSEFTAVVMQLHEGRM